MLCSMDSFTFFNVYIIWFCREMNEFPKGLFISFLSFLITLLEKKTPTKAMQCMQCEGSMYNQEAGA